MGLRPGYMGLMPGWLRLRPGLLGLRPGWVAQRGDGRTDGHMDGRMDGLTDVSRENLPILQDLVPYRGRCPASQRKI